MAVETRQDPETATGAARNAACLLYQRALDLWPRLDMRVLNRCGCDTRKIARYVSRRTSLSIEAIEALLERAVTTSPSEAGLWFG